jgi:hypothetical protein
MTTAKKPQEEPSAAYKLAAAEMRAKVASNKLAIEHEVLPSGGRIRLVLKGRPIARGELEALFGPSAIDLPELRRALK